MAYSISALHCSCLRLRASELCTWGALQTTIRVFWVPRRDHRGRTFRPRHLADLRHLDGRSNKHPVFFFRVYFRALEQVVMKKCKPFLRHCSRWMSDAGARCFSDHRGIKPSIVTGSTLSASLTWSETIGSEKAILSKPLVIGSCCCVSYVAWLATGWSLLTSKRDLTSATTCCRDPRLDWPEVLVLNHAHRHGRHFVHSEDSPLLDTIFPDGTSQRASQSR